MNIKNQRKNITLLPDGRRFSWYDSGPETGIPVVFCTGAGMSGSAGFGIPYLADNNIRLITPDRPGSVILLPMPENHRNPLPLMSLF